MGLFNWLFGKAAEKVVDDEYGTGQTAYKPEPVDKSANPTSMIPQSTDRPADKKS